MNETTKPKIYDLEDRTLNFAKAVVLLCKKLKKETVNFEISSQLVRSAGSVGANYIEANEALSKKDFAHRLKISRKEAKETIYWLEILHEANLDLSAEIIKLIKEATELKKIYLQL